MGPAVWIGDWRVDPALDLLQKGDQLVKLEPRKTRLLMALAERPGELVLADELIDTVWKDVIVTPNSLYQSVAQLRRQLGDDADAARYIVTVPRKGYRLIAPVRTEAQVEAATMPAPPPVDANAASDAAAAAEATSPAAVQAAGAGERILVAPDAAAAGLIATGHGRRRRLVAALAALAAASAASWWWLRRIGPPPQPQPIRLAVVAFRDESEDLDGAVLADALSEEVIHALSAHPGLRVVARDSAHTFRAGALDPAQVAARLGVEHVLEGVLRRSGPQLRLELTLHDAAAARPRWRRTVVRPSADLPRLPRLVAGQIEAALGLASAMPQRPQEPSLAAFEAYVQGWAALRQRTPESLRTAREHFARAIAADPDYAQAHTALALAWIAETDYGTSIAFDSAIDQARAALQRALDLAPEAPEALGADGLLHIKLRQLEPARERLRRAIAARPSYTAAHFWLGLSYAFEGRPREAMPHYAVVAELNPLDFQIHARLGTETLFAGLSDQARRHFERARELAPHHPNPLWGQAMIGYARGRLDEAVLAYRGALALEKRRSDLWQELGWMYLDLGLPKLALRSLEASGLRPGASSDYGAMALRSGIAAATAEPAALPLPAQPLSLAEHIVAALAATRRRDPALARQHFDAITALWPRQYLAVQGPMALFHDRLPSLDVAAVAVRLGDRDADPWLDLSRGELDRLERGGCVWHGLAHQRARLLALTDAPQAAAERLAAAIESGWRRFWHLPLDPAFGGWEVRQDVQVVIAAAQAELAKQRARVEREAG
jgi:DNA-binding winged helix-turn-helix (wHTH) protein/TolB-like protein/Tfp pilus assembly protein PilF